MPQWKNISESTFERAGDGEGSPGWTAEPGDIVEADQNPAPGSFEEVGAETAAPEAPEAEPAASPEADAPADPGE